MIVKARFRDLEPEPGQAVSSAARLLAMAHAIEAALESGHYRSAAEAARTFGVTRARLSQLMHRRWAAVAEQERILGAQHTGRE